MNAVPLALRLASFALLSPLGEARPVPFQEPAREAPALQWIEPEEGWQLANLERAGTLVFRFRNELTMLDIRSGQLAKVKTTSNHMGHSTPTWSRDGKLMFDFEQQVIAIAAEDGQVTALSSYPVRQGWAEAYPEQDKPRYIHDAEHHRLIYVEISLLTAAEPKLVAIDLETHAKVSLIDALGKDLRGCAVSLNHEKLFAACGNRLITWSLAGTKLAETPLPDACAFPTLSPDATLIAVQKSINYRETANVDRDKGCWLVDVASMKVVDEIPFGQQFVWSFKSNRLAFLRWSEELWIYEAEAKTRSRIARLTLMEGTSDLQRNQYYAAPAWSQDDRLLACTLARPSGEKSHDYVTLVADLDARALNVARAYFEFLSWSPVERPFGNAATWDAGEGK